MAIEFIILFMIAIVLLHLYISRHFDYWQKAGVICMQPQTYWGALKGSLLGASKEMYTFAPEEPYVGLVRLTSLAVCIRDPDIIRDVLAKDFNHFHDRGLSFNEQEDILSSNLFFLEGKRWKILRAKLTPTFTSGKLRAMFPLVKYCVDQMTEIVSTHADKPESVEMNDLLSRCTTDVILSCAFGLQGNSLKDPNDIYLKMVKKNFKMTRTRIMLNILSTTFPNLGKRFPLTRERRENSEFFLNAFSATVAQREKSGVKRNDFLDLLLEIKKNGFLTDGQAGEDAVDSSLEFTNELMAAQAWVFFVAGSETSSSTTSFALVELANNVHIQDRLREEIDKSIGRHGGLTYEGVMEMQYLDQVVSETLRLWSPATVLPRRVTKPYTMPDGRVTLEKGMRVVIPVRGLHTDPKYYPEPERFDPERFTPEAIRDRHKYVYIPFGDGPRICIGQRFGLLQVKLALASLLAQFEFRPKPGVTYPPIVSNKSFITSCERGAPVLITKRKPEQTVLS